MIMWSVDSLIVFNMTIQFYGCANNVPMLMDLLRRQFVWHNNNNDNNNNIHISIPPQAVVSSNVGVTYDVATCFLTFIKWDKTKTHCFNLYEPQMSFTVSASTVTDTIQDRNPTHSLKLSLINDTFSNIGQQALV